MEIETTTCKEYQHFGNYTTYWFGRDFIGCGVICRYDRHGRDRNSEVALKCHEAEPVRWQDWERGKVSGYLWCYCPDGPQRRKNHREEQMTLGELMEVG